MDSFKQFGIGGAQIRPLLYILKHPGVRQDDISKVFSKDKGTVARATKNLKKLILFIARKISKTSAPINFSRLRMP